MSYSYEIWQEIGVIELLIEKNIPFLALDMPYGVKSKCHPKTRDIEKNIAFINSAINGILENKIPLLVGASIGGNMALNYATRFAVKGLFLVAPARALEPNLSRFYSDFKFPSVVIRGSYDTLVAEEEMRALTDQLPNSRFVVYNGAGHSAYRDQAEKFKHDLLELYAKIE